MGNQHSEPVVQSSTVTSAQGQTHVRSRSTLSQSSDAISTHISSSKKSYTADFTESAASHVTGHHKGSPQNSGSESSIPEDVQSGSAEEGQTSSPEKQPTADSSDDTIINSSLNEEEESESPPGRTKGKKSPVGRLLPPGNSLLPQPWSRKTGSESESEESVSHTGQQRRIFSFLALWIIYI